MEITVSIFQAEREAEISGCALGKKSRYDDDERQVLGAGEKAGW